MEHKPILFRFRESDTHNGVTRNTLKRLAKTLGVSETDAIHKVLAESARAHLPQYEADDGALTATQYALIKKAVGKTHGRAKIVDSLFSHDVSGGSGIERKKIRAPARAG